MCMLICIHMLTKRTNILFDESLWRQLVKLSEAKKTSVGALIREAVEEKYQEKVDLERRRQVIENILKIRPKPVKGKIDYKALINAGRKY